MSTVIVPSDAGEALGMLECAAGFLADLDAPGMPAEAVAGCLRGMERADAVQAAARGRLLAAFDAKDGPTGDGQRTARAWLVHSLRVTPEVVAVSKAELPGSEEVRARLERGLGREVLAISAVTGQGLAKLVGLLAERLGEEKSKPDAEKVVL